MQRNNATQQLISALSQQCHLHHLRVATAESCTGGGISASITTLSGVSSWFQGAAVCYDNQAKVNVLGVPDSLLQRHGAVSQAVVETMALAVGRKFNANLTVATSGVLGPTGGSLAKPVGTVWFAVALHQQCVRAEKQCFDAPRVVAQSLAIQHALQLLLTVASDLG